MHPTCVVFQIFFGILCAYFIDTKQAFLELQGKAIEYNRILGQLQGKLQASKTEKRRCQITLQEVADLTPETKTYKAIGTYPLKHTTHFHSHPPQKTPQLQDGICVYCVV